MPIFSNGFFLRLSAVGFITAMSAVIRILAQELPIGQIIFWRSAVALVPILIYLWLRGQLPHGLRTKRPKAHILRSAFGTLSMGLSFVSLAYLSVANASALAYLTPILSLPLAAIWLGERVGWRAIVACILGFTGVVLMLQSALGIPETGKAAWIGVGAGLGYAITMAFVRVHIKDMMATETPASVPFYFAIIGAMIGALSAFWGWLPATGTTLMLLMLAGVLGGLAHITSAEAVARSPVSTLAVFDYTGMIWALGFDIILFGLWPDAPGLIGVFAILAGALLILREKNR